MRIKRLLAGKTKHPKAPGIAEPIGRRIQVLVLNKRPAVGQPELGAPIATISNEFEVLTTTYRPRRDAERTQQDIMAGPFVVEGEAVAVMAD